MEGQDMRDGGDTAVGGGHRGRYNRGHEGLFYYSIMSNKIQVTVKKQLINRFKENIIEGQTYQMAYFSIIPNQGNCRTAEHEFKLIFLNRTTVVPIPDDAILKTCFSLCPFDELLKMTENYVYLVDVISLLTSVGEEKEYVKDDKVMKMIFLELSLKELIIRCALFGEYVDEVHHFLGFGYMEQPVVVIQLVKVKFFRGQVGLQNVMHATCLFFNFDLAEVVDFKNRVCDAAAIIAMFELPNYDADDECTPVKDVEVPGLDDISSEVDIMKEKEKNIDESIPVDRECSLEIEKILFAVLDGSPIHVIKKETVENPPRGAKVKRNLKKVFGDVADEEFGPTSNVLKNRDS
nr:uncharacterized protein LOC112701620 [Arachis hypogaea]